MGSSAVCLRNSLLSCLRAGVPAGLSLSPHGHTVGAHTSLSGLDWTESSSGQALGSTHFCVPCTWQGPSPTREPIAPAEQKEAFWKARSGRDARGNREWAPWPWPSAPRWWWPRTWSPEGDALLLVGLADAVVAVAVHSLTRVPVVQVHVGRAVRTGSRAELREVAGVARVPARCSCRLQLKGEGRL